MVHPVENCGFARSYIISGDKGLMVIDAGSIGTVEDITAAIHRLGKTHRDVRFIAATHFHIDHIGGFGEMLSKCPPDTNVLFHRIVGDYLHGKRRISLLKNWIMGLIPATVSSMRNIRKASHLNFESLAGIPLPGLRNRVVLPYQQDRITYFGGDGLKRYPLGFDDWEVIETPGHTEDSVSFYHETSRELVCGDLILNMERGGHGKLNRFYSSREDILASFYDLSRTIKPKVIYPGHGDPIRDSDNALKCVKTFL
jgi:glyoxylase-like metal-dependent hydrolase (beta-lactamase superfamily II)